jgi:hypothetical protein
MVLPHLLVQFHVINTHSMPNDGSCRNQFVVFISNNGESSLFRDTMHMAYRITLFHEIYYTSIQ